MVKRSSKSKNPKNKSANLQLANRDQRTPRIRAKHLRLNRVNASEAGAKDNKTGSVNDNLDMKSQKSGNEDLEMAVINPRTDTPASDVSFERHRFTDVKPKGNF